MDDDAESRIEQDEAPCHGEEERCQTECPSCVAELERQKKENDALNDRYLRLAADFENFKKRSAREMQMCVSSANERFAIDILEVLDNFERAIKSDDAHLREGVSQIQQLLMPGYCATVSSLWTHVKNNLIRRNMKQSHIFPLTNRQARW